MDMTVSLRTLATDDHRAVASHRDAPSGQPDGAADKVVGLGFAPALSDGNADALGPLSQVYPPAFDRDTMRWIPLIVPLLGFFIAVLTGLMWMVIA